MKVRALGYKYTDKFPTHERLGGVYNFGTNPIMVNREIKCYFDSDYKKTLEIACYERAWAAPSFIDMSGNAAVHVMYGDSDGIKEMLAENDNHSFLSVDFIKQLEDIDLSLVRWWTKRANILFFSIKSLDTNIPFWLTNVVAHCADGVIYRCEGVQEIVKNRYKIEGLKNLIGAGDRFAYEILSAENISRTSIDRANKKTSEYLRNQNEPQI